MDEMTTVTIGAPLLSTADAVTAKLYAALAGARGEFPDIPRNRTATVRMKSGGSYSYTYADLADVFRAINPVLAAYGLAVMQFPKNNELHTVLVHEAGGKLCAEPWPIKAMPTRGLDDAQSYQSAVQVAKRYALTALLGITTEETVEGTVQIGRDRQTSENIDAKFRGGDGIRLPRGAKIQDGWTPRQIAEEAARAIEEQMREVKTTVGVDGVWRRNEMFIEKFREHYPDIFSNIFDIYEMLADEKSEAARAEAGVTVPN